MGITLGIGPGQQLDILPYPGGTEACTQGAAVDVRGHTAGHHAGGRRYPQAVVVHHMVGVVVVHSCLQLPQAAAIELLLEAQPEAFPFELGAVHAASGVTRFAVPGTHAQLQQGVVIRGPAQRQVGIPFVPARWHPVAIAIFIIAGAGAVAAQPQIALTAADRTVQLQIPAGIGAGHHSGIQPRTRLVETFRQAIEQHGARRGTRPPGHGLRTLDYGQLIEVLRGDIGGRRIHPRGTGTEHFAAVGQQLEPRAEHAAQHRITVAAATAHCGKTGDGLQVVGPVTGRDRLAGILGVGDDGQR